MGNRDNSIAHGWECRENVIHYDEPNTSRVWEKGILRRLEGKKEGDEL